MEPKYPVRKKMESWLSSAEKVGGDDNLLTQILLHLPARLIVRFKLVNKKWLYFITGTYFPLIHIRSNPKPPISGLYYSRGRNTYCIPLEGHSLPTFTLTAAEPEQSSMMSPFRIHDSRHGLILCSFLASFSWKSKRIFIWNPTTQKFITFHRSGLNLSGTPVAHFYLYFDPCISPTYKLILIKEEGSHYDVYICPSNSSVWMNIRLETQLQWGRLIRYGFLSSDGIIYMMTDRWYVVKFEVETEKLSTARTTFEPELPFDHREVEYFGERDGSNLVLIVSSEFEDDLLIYEMKKLDGQHWYIKYNINIMQELRNLQKNYDDRSQFAVMWVFWKGENENSDMTLVLRIEGTVISYNLNRREVKEICALPGEDSFGETAITSEVHPFIASLCAV